MFKSRVSNKVYSFTIHPGESFVKLHLDGVILWEVQTFSLEPSYERFKQKCRFNSDTSSIYRSGRISNDELWEADKLRNSAQTLIKKKRRCGFSHQNNKDMYV